MSETKEDRPISSSSEPLPNTDIEREKGSCEHTHGAQEDTNEDIVYPTGLVLAAIVLALCLAVFLVALDQTIIATAIPRITDRFQSVKDIGWYGAVRLQCTIFTIVLTLH
jgi:hypothetical protein